MATPALPFAQLATECEAEGLSPNNAEKIGHELARIFGVKQDEVGILRLEKQHLVFCYPARLHNVGSIPLNTSTSDFNVGALAKRQKQALAAAGVPAGAEARAPKRR